MDAIPYESSYGLLNFIEHKNDMHASGALQKLAIGCLVFKLSKLKFRAHNLFDGVHKRS